MVIALVIGILLYRWLEDRHEKNEKDVAERELRVRLDENWSTLLTSDYVGSLSEMPEQWKSGIVPKTSDTGIVLDQQLQSMAEQIKQKPACASCRTREHSVKDELYKFMEQKVAPFFMARDQMYTNHLLKNPSMKVTRPEYPSVQTDASVSIQKIRTIRLTDLIWPKNTTPLFQQVMYLQRDLDDMFKNSYNQRFMLRIMNAQFAAWNDWVVNTLPTLRLPEFFKQNTSDVFELYRQAAEVHWYYDRVLKGIAKEAGATWIPSPLKNIFRVLEKAERVKHSNDDSMFFDCSAIFDIVRGTLVCDTLGDVQGGVLRAVRALVDSIYFQVVRVKDRFNKPTSACWRDVLINGRMVSPDRNFQSLILEVQIHEKQLREERKNVGGHYMYQRHRALFEACEVACGRELVTAMLKDLHIPLEEERNSERLQRTFTMSMDSLSLSSALPNSMIPPSPAGQEPQRTSATDARREIEMCETLLEMSSESLRSSTNQLSTDSITISPFNSPITERKEPVGE